MFLEIAGESVEAFNAASRTMKCLQLANGAIYTDAAGNWSEVHDRKLAALEDIIEEFVGEFTTSLPGLGQELCWSANNDAIVEGTRPLREVNRMLELDFPLEGPKTINGLILEHFQDIPESGISIKLAGIPVEILQTQNRSVVTVRIFRPCSK